MLNALKLRLPVLLPLIILMILAAGIGVFMSATDYDWQGMVLVAVIVGIVAVFLIPRLTRQESDSFLLKVLVFGLLLKLGFSLGRNWVAFGVYGGSSDSSSYNDYGIVIAQYIRQMEFGQIVPFLQWGTKFVDFFTGFIYALVGPSIYGGFLVYGFLAFLGSYYYYRAFRVAFPEGNKWLYTILIFFYPSILYWPNGIGKDALMFLCLGLFAYGSAQIIKNQRRGFLPSALGLIGMLWVRPYIAVISALAFVMAFFLPVAGKRQVRATTFVIVILVLGVSAWLILPHFASYIGVQELSPQGLLNRLQQQQVNTSEGGSAFQAMNLMNPLTYPIAMITLLFRPFPWEAHNLQALIQSLEGVLFIGLVLWRIKSIGKAIAAAISNVYLRYNLIYIIAFIIIFSAIANFGLIARERTMILPFFFMLIAYTPFHARLEDKAVDVAVK